MQATSGSAASDAQDPDDSAKRLSRRETRRLKKVSVAMHADMVTEITVVDLGIDDKL